MRDLLAALDTLAGTDATTAQRDQAAAHVADCHSRAERACADLARQLTYAHELTDRLARYR